VMTSGPSDFNNNRIYRTAANVGTSNFGVCTPPADRGANPLTILHGAPYKL